MPATDEANAGMLRVEGYTLDRFRQLDFDDSVSHAFSMTRPRMSKPHAARSDPVNNLPRTRMRSPSRILALNAIVTSSPGGP